MREAVNRVLELAPSLGLTHLEFRVLVYLADRHNKQTGQLNPSPERLARDCGLDPDSSERSIRRVIDRLEAKGLVERLGNRIGGREPGGRYPRDGLRLREDITSTLRVDIMSGEGGHGVPQNQGSRTRERGNLPSGSTRRVEQARPRPQNHSRERMLPLLAEIQVYDESATWVEGEGIRFESGKTLRTVQDAKKYLQFLDDGEPGSW
jgi:hypothetical protein